MSSISAIRSEAGSLFRLECRVTPAPTEKTNDGKVFTPFLLEDMTGDLLGYLPHTPDEPRFRYAPNSHAIALIEIEERSSCPTTRILEMLPLRDPTFPARSLPRSWCPLPDQLPLLADCVETLSYMPLIRFMRRVLTDDRIMKPFLSIPASIDNHHSYPGGLLAHSLECAARVHNFLGSETDTLTMELGTIAALLHDVGKIEVLSPEMRYQDSARLLDHDGYTREVLGPHLSQLEALDRDAAHALRYLLTWKENEHQRSPKIPLAMAIRMADRFSAANDSAKRAFLHTPKWKQLVTPEGRGPKRTYWRSRKHDIARATMRTLKLPQ